MTMLPTRFSAQWIPSRSGCSMTDDGDTPRPAITVAFALASERSIVKFVSQGSSVESNQSSNFTAYDIWCAGLSPEAFPLIGR
ncbi:hypothetical protein V8E52_005845 [Russula decolorans]|jgi:hypothetical protein